MSARTIIAIVIGTALCGAAYYGFCRTQPEPGASGLPSAATSGATPEVVLKTDAEAAELPRSIDNEPGHSKSGKRPVESILFANHRIHVDRANAVVSGEGFEEFLQDLDRDNAADLEARELSKAYEASLIAVTTGQSDSGLQLSKIACGLSICGADLTSATEDQERFNLIMNSGESSGARIYSAVTSIVPNRDGTFSYRIIFSTDPAGSTLQVPRNPGPIAIPKRKS
jgi:hypothetical protein